MRGRRDLALRAECVRLRVEERLSLREIAERTSVSKGSLSVWLKPFPLTDKEKRMRHRLPRRDHLRKQLGVKSKFYEMAAGQELTRLRKAKIAETAVLFRLVLHGFIPYGSPFDGDKTDWLVESPNGKLHKIQVRTTKNGTHGLPKVSLHCTEGHNKQRRFRNDEFDFIVGYCLFNDIAYVWSFDELAHLRSYVTISEAAAERWDKLR